MSDYVTVPLSLNCVFCKAHLLILLKIKCVSGGFVRAKFFGHCFLDILICALRLDEEYGPSKPKFGNYPRPGGPPLSPEIQRPGLYTESQVVRCNICTYFVTTLSGLLYSVTVTVVSKLVLFLGPTSE